MAIGLGHYAHTRKNLKILFGDWQINIFKRNLGG